MAWEYIISVLAGIFFGIITGLIPGVHINLVSILLVSLSGYFLGFTDPLVLGVFVVAMAVTHTFLDSIPSVFLGAPDVDMALAALPGHKLLLEGKGYEAVKLTVIGSLLSLLVVIAIIPFLIPIVPLIYSFIQPYIGWILIFVVVYMIFKETGLKKKFWGIYIFILSGILGLVVFKIPNLEQPLLPMLSGLFGVSILVNSLSQNTSVPKQKITETITIPKGNLVKAISAATFSGSLTGLLPGLGSAQAAIIAMQIVGNIGNYAFMVLVGGINTVNFVFSLATFYTLEKARNGAIVAVMDIMKSINVSELVVLLGAALLAGGIATFLALKITKGFAFFICKVNYKILCISVISFISLLVIYFSSWVGFLVLVVSTAIGLIPNLLSVKRSLAMGCLLLPVIFYFVF